MVMDVVRERSLGSTVVAAAAGVIVLAGVHAAADLAVLVALSILVAILLVPLQRALIGRGLPGGVALLACLAVYVVVVVVAGLAIAIGLAGFLRDLPTYRSDLDAAIADVGAPVVDADAIEAAVRSLAAGAIGAVATVGYSVFIVAYLLLDAPGMASRLRAAFGDSSSVPTRAAATADRLRTYLVARAILGAIAAVLDTVLLVILGVPDALLWGMLSFLLSFIPNIGFIVALIPPTIVGLLGRRTADRAPGGRRLLGHQRCHRLCRPAPLRRLRGEPVGGGRDRVAPVLGGRPWRHPGHSSRSR